MGERSEGSEAGRVRVGPYQRGSLGRLIAEVAVITGIPPESLAKDSDMLTTIVDVLNERAKKR